MSVFLSYIILGLSLAAPIGPINAAQIDKGIKGGFFHSWFVGLGAMVADVLYMLLVYLGVVHFLETPFMKTFLWLFGFFILTYTGIESLIEAGKLELTQKRGRESLAKTFMYGFFMSLSNPLTILFWLGIYGSVLANTAANYGFNQLLIYSGAIILGVIIWDFTMAGIASTFRNFLSTKVLVIISFVSGLSLIGFGLYFGYQAFVVLFG